MKNETCNRNVFRYIFIASLFITLSLLFLEWYLYESKHFRFFLSINNQTTAETTTPDSRLEELLVDDEANCDSETAFPLVKNQSTCQSLFRPKDWKLVNDDKSFDGVIDFRRVVLIVSFNKPHFRTLPKIHRLYDKLFLKIVYCITGLHKLDAYRNGTYLPLVNVSFVELTREPTNPTGEVFYMCLPRTVDQLADVRQMVDNEVVDGFLHISDDLLPHLWRYKTKNLKLENNWLLGLPQALYDVDTKGDCKGKVWNNSVDCPQPSGWHVLRQYQKQLIATMDEAAVNYSNFTNSLAKQSSGERRVWNIYADLFYVSRHFLEPALEMFRLFGSHHVYMELAVGTIFKGITQPPERLQWISRRGQIYGPYRDMKVTETWEADAQIYHPLKLGTAHNDTIDRQCLYCTFLNAYDKLRQRLLTTTP